MAINNNVMTSFFPSGLKSQLRIGHWYHFQDLSFSSIMRGQNGWVAVSGNHKFCWNAKISRPGVNSDNITSARWRLLHMNDSQSFNVIKAERWYPSLELLLAIKSVQKTSKTYEMKFKISYNFLFQFLGENVFSKRKGV